MSVTVIQTQINTLVVFYGMEEGPVSWGLDNAAAWCVQIFSFSLDRENTCTELAGEEEATDTPVETNLMIHLHSARELTCELHSVSRNSKKHRLF